MSISIKDPAQFGRVAVAMGGHSAEREISLVSGRNVLAALQSRGIDAQAVDGIPSLLDAVRAGHFARVFNILHGGSGENGELQGALQSLGVPFTGSGVLGSALSMDKIRTKQVWLALGLPTPDYRVLAPDDSAHRAAQELGFPLIVKPSLEGSSIGVSRVFAEQELDAAVALARRYPGHVLMEALIDTRQGAGEFAVGILDREVLPSIHIVPKHDYYDYNAKYVAEDTSYLCPGLQGSEEQALGALAFKAFDVLGCSGWGRVDLMRDAQGRCWLLEANTTPGMTNHSLVPKAAQQRGIDFATLCWRILETSLRGDV